MRRFICSGAVRLFFCVIALCPTLLGATLREVLTQKNLTLQAPLPDDVDLNITSWEAHRDERGYFVIAYYLESRVVLPDELRVLSVNPMTGEWKQRIIHESEPPLNGRGIGAVTRIFTSEKYVYIGGHTSPSAGPTLVLTPQLDSHDLLAGWPLAVFRNGLALYHKNMRHFAPVHQAQLSLYDPRTRSHRLVYPPERESPVRSRHIADLQQAFAAKDDQWFAAQNRARDATCFDEAVGDVAIDEESASFAFEISIDRTALGTGEDRWRLVYVFRGVRTLNGSLEYVEVPASDLESRFGTGWPADLLKPDIRNQLFAGGEGR